MTLWCVFYEGTEEASPITYEVHEEAFPVQITRGTVHVLKKLIQAKKPKNIDARHFQLWKWNQPGNNYRIRAGELDSSNMLNPMTKITSIFGDDPPKDECIHFIIKVPELGK